MKKLLRLTRVGCLAVHLMPTYTGATLTKAVKRIVRCGPRGKFERDAVQRANLEHSPDPKIRSKSVATH